MCRYLLQAQVHDSQVMRPGAAAHIVDRVTLNRVSRYVPTHDS